MKINFKRLDGKSILGLEDILRDERVTIPSGLQLPAGESSFLWALQTLANYHHCFGIYYGEDEQLVGMICCDQVKQDEEAQSKEFEISYLIGHRWWGHHIMTNALQQFCRQYKRKEVGASLIATTLATNVASQKVLKRVGFKKINDDHQGVISWRYDY